MAFPRHFYLPFFLLFILPGAGCEENERDREIDRQYLESGEYENFDRESRREAEQRATKGGTLRERLQLLPGCSDTGKLDLPLTIDEEDLEQLLQENSPECPGLNPAGTGEPEIKLLGRLSADNPAVWLLLLEHPSVYKNRELLVATTDDEELIAFRTVALYRKNISRDISAELRISEEEGVIRLRSESHRKISYPIRQESSVREEVAVRGDGSIRKAGNP